MNLSSPDALRTALRSARDYLSALLDLPHSALIDSLSANGEAYVALWDKTLGHDAYPVGCAVRVQPNESNEATEQFVGTVTGRKTNTNGALLFTVTDQEDNAFDCELSNLRPYTD